MPEVKPWDSYALAVETKVRLPNVYSPKRTSMSDGGRRKKTKDAIFFIYPLDKQQVGQAKPQKAAVTSQASTETQPSQVPGAVVLFVGFRVGAAGYPAAPPTDPDVNNSLIRFLGSTPSYRSRCQTGDTPVGA